MTALRNVALVGFAQLPVVARDQHRTATEMLYPVVVEALEQVGASRDAIDYQVSASADYMDGRPFGFVQALDVMGSWPPRQDLHLEMDGSFATYYAWLKIQTGEVDTALVCAHGKTSEGEPERVLNLELDPFYQAPLGLGPTTTAALQASAYMAHTGTTDRDLAERAARRRSAGARNPDNLVRDPASADALQATPWAAEPLRTGYLPALGETAVCLVLAAEEKAHHLCDRPVWIQGVDHRSELQSIGARDLTRSAGARLAAERAYAMAGIAGAGDVHLAELLTLTPVEELIVCDALGIDANAETPVINPSGGPLCSYPLLGTGLIRLGECFRQLAGRAGERSVAGATRAIAHGAQGHCLQQNVVWVLGSERRWA